MTDLTPLIERLEKADDGGSELSLEVWNACFPGAEKVSGVSVKLPDGDIVSDWFVTDNLDDALLLVDRVFGGTFQVLMTIGRWEAFASVYDRDPPHPRSVKGHSEGCDTPPLALCAALLKALQNKESAA